MISVSAKPVDEMVESMIMKIPGRKILFRAPKELGQETVEVEQEIEKLDEIPDVSQPQESEEDQQESIDINEPFPFRCVTAK